MVHPYGISVLGDFVYWTDWELKALHKAPKTSGSPIVKVRSGLSGLMDVKALPVSIRIGFVFRDLL